MGLLQKLKSALGLDGAQSTASSGTDSERDVDVTVEREPSTESEDAVKGTETATTGSEPAGLETDDEQEGDEVAADAAASTDADAAEPESATAPDAVAESVSASESAVDSEPVAEAEPETTSEPEPEPDLDFEGADDPVTDIKGIGPAYADRLSGLGIETVGDLAVADAADIAAQTDLAESRVAGWIERANDY